MKKLLLAICLVTFTTSLFAEVYECENTDQKFLLALTYDSGIIYDFEHGYFKEIKGNVKVSRAMDGGPTNVQLHHPAPTEDDLKGKDYIIKVGYNFTVNNPRAESKLQYLPQLFVNPATPDHAVPRLALGMPQSIECKLL